MFSASKYIDQDIESLDFDLLVLEIGKSPSNEVNDEIKSFEDISNKYKFLTRLVQCLFIGLLLAFSLIIMIIANF